MTIRPDKRCCGRPCRGGSGLKPDGGSRSTRTVAQVEEIHLRLRAAAEGTSDD
ncbi:hypothetical protein [Frankia sp. KB5]|uniref:hypothetical protein n=1 Tax=Frankia sp. KB5 TaxID=683318 RepID=UPI001A7E0CB8|nr:hypothetical protein [Frankia sp. KB5]